MLEKRGKKIVTSLQHNKSKEVADTLYIKGQKCEEAAKKNHPVKVVFNYEASFVAIDQKPKKSSIVWNEA